jgi:multidrug efflux pump
VLVGLACKNAILIVEFAKLRREEGVSRREATLQACELRLRPIVMTSFAFILGVVPLVIATGAGAEMRKALGVTVFSGMLGVTAFGVLLTPVFFYVIDTLSGSQQVSQSRLARWGAGVLNIIRLRPLRPLIRATWNVMTRRPAPTGPATAGLKIPDRPSTNGHTSPPSTREDTPHSPPAQEPLEAKH